MKRLRQLREELKMTQVRLAIELGVSQETISGYEIGKAVPPADMLCKLADCLHTSVDYLLERTDVKNSFTFSEQQLSSLEHELILVFRKLPLEKQQRALGFTAGLAE